MSMTMAGAGELETFGEQLRRAREERGVTVEAICDSTKFGISVKGSLKRLKYFLVVFIVFGQCLCAMAQL